MFFKYEIPFEEDKKNKVAEMLMESYRVSLAEDIVPLMREKFWDRPVDERTMLVCQEWIKEGLIKASYHNIRFIAIPSFTWDKETGIYLDDIIYERWN